MPPLSSPPPSRFLQLARISLRLCGFVQAIQDGGAMFASSVGTEAAAVVRKMVNLSSPPRRRCSSKMVKGRTGQRVRLYVRGTILEVRSSLCRRGSAPSPSRGYLNSWSWLGAQIQADPSEHQGGRGLVRRQEDGLRLQGQDQATTPTTTTSGARSPSPMETLASSAPSSPSLRPW